MVVRPRPSALRPYDVVEVHVDEDPDGVPDPTEPEALALARAPEAAAAHGAGGGPSACCGRCCTRRPAPSRPALAGHPVLGAAAPIIPRSPWSSRRARSPCGGTGAYLACRFVWQGLERELPCLDRRLASELDRAGRTRAVGAKGDRLVVALTPPIDGRCRKVVAAVLHRP